MEQVFISNMRIEKVRHLREIDINLSKNNIKHLIITGKNGSGKTSLLNAMAYYLNMIITDDIYNQSNESNVVEKIESYENNTRRLLDDSIKLEMNHSREMIHSLFEEGKFVVAFYQADRVFKVHTPKHVEKVELKNGYTIAEAPREDFIKYLLDLKMTEALALSNGKKDKADRIRIWYECFEKLLREIFENDSTRLEFDEETFKFHIYIDGREPFEFNELSSGYAAVLDIVVDLIIRMEKQTNKVFDFSIPGIVLIDEIETHLHLGLQKKILELLTGIFPNIQFIVSTHSPFVLNSLENVTIYDLEKHLLVENGLADVPYGGIVEGYFNADAMSVKLRDKYEKYKELVNKSQLTDDDFEEITELEMYLDEIPDYLALNVTTEYQRLKMHLKNREDI